MRLRRAFGGNVSATDAAMTSTANPRAPLGYRALPAAYFLAATALAAALAHFTWMSPQPLAAYRLGAILIGLLLGVANLRAGVLLIVFAAPLAGLISRLLGAYNLSLSEHALIPLLLCGSFVVGRGNQARAGAAIGRRLALFTALAVISSALGLWEYRALHRPLWETVIAEADRHFSFDIGDVLRGSFTLLHGVAVIVEGALWFVLLTSPALRLRASHLRGALTLSVGAAALTGVAQTIWLFDLPSFFRLVQPDLLRINGALPDPNTFGCFLILVGPIAVASTWMSAAGRPAGLGLLTLLSYCLVQTVSRSAWVGLGGAFGIALMLAGWRSQSLALEIPASAARLIRRLFWTGAAGVLLAFLLVSVGALRGGPSRVSASSPLDMLLFSFDLRRPANDLVPARMDHWLAALRIWCDFPLFGAGTGKYVSLKLHYLPDVKLPTFTDAHSYYLKTLSELGVAGLGTFLAILGCIATQARVAWLRAGRSQRPRIAAIALGVLAFALSSLAQDPLGLGAMQCAFWTVVALLVLEDRENTPGLGDAADKDSERTAASDSRAATT